MRNIEILKNILYGSKTYKFNGAILELADYNTGEILKLHLGVLLENESVLENMIEKAIESEEM